MLIYVDITNINPNNKKWIQSHFQQGTAGSIGIESQMLHGDHGAGMWAKTSKNKKHGSHLGIEYTTDRNNI